MAPGEKKGDDLYAVLGLGKECTSTDLKKAYKKLAMIWHPDRCSAPGNFRLAEEAKKKFQVIQEAYSVLSDHNKRLLYDVGMYDKEDDDNNNGMGDFLSEMATMMSQAKANENGQGTFEEFQELFDNIFHSNDTPSFASSSSSSSSSRNPRFQNFCGKVCKLHTQYSSIILDFGAFFLHFLYDTPFVEDRWKPEEEQIARGGCGDVSADDLCNII